MFDHYFFSRFLIRTLQSDLFPSESQRERIREKSRKEVLTATTSIACSSSTSNSSTYRNPTFEPPSNNSPDIAQPDIRFVPGKRAIQTRSAHYNLQYGGSTPDLSSKSPYYGAHNTNNSSNLLFTPVKHPGTLSQGGDEPHSSSFVNAAFVDQDADTGEYRPEDAFNPRRSSMKRAYGEYGDAGASVLPPYGQLNDYTFESYDDVAHSQVTPSDVLTIASVDPSLDIKSYSEDADVV